jgi:hypothetical protein
MEKKMAWKQIITYTRPNTSVDWAMADNSCKDHIVSTYEDTGKSVSFTTVLSADELTLTKTRTFDSEASFNEYRNDSVIRNTTSDITSYNNYNSITKTSQTGDL